MTNPPHPPLPVSVASVSRWRSTTGLRTALTWLFAVDALACAALVAAHLHRASVISRYLDLSASRSDLVGADDLVTTATAVLLPLFLACAVVLIVWQFRSAKNNEVLGKIRPRFTPGWSVGGWFIPLANFVIPVRIFQDLWQGADPETHNQRDWRGLRRAPVIAWWWTFYTVAGIVQITVSHGSTLDQVRNADRLTAVASGLLAIAAVLAIAVVRTITARQQTALAAVRSIVAGPGWYPDPLARFDHRYWDGSTWTANVSRAGQMTTDFDAASD